MNSQSHNKGHGAVNPADRRGAADGASQGAELQLVSFLLEGTEYAIELSGAVELLKPGHVTEVPRSPWFIKGIVPVSGEMVAVIDLKGLLGAAPSEGRGQKGGRLLMAGENDLKAAFLVDSINGIRDYRASAFKASAPAGKGKGFIKGTVSLDGRVLNVLCVKKLLEFAFADH